MSSYVSRGSLLAKGLYEVRPNVFVLYREEVLFDARLRRGVKQRRLVGSVELDKTGSVVRTTGDIGVKDGVLSLWHRVDVQSLPKIQPKRVVVPVVERLNINSL